jgi:hypothetical protein
LNEVAHDGNDPVPAITDFPAFACGFLQWPNDCLHGLDPAWPLPDTLTVALQEGESISPSFAFKDPRLSAASNPQSQILNPKSSIPNPQSQIPNPGPAIRMAHPGPDTPGRHGPRCPHRR